MDDMLYVVYGIKQCSKLIVIEVVTEQNGEIDRVISHEFTAIPDYTIYYSVKRKDHISHGKAQQ